jgi:hypothetical protein
MKTLDVSWKTDQRVAIEITSRETQQLQTKNAKQLVRVTAVSGNLIIITCSGGVLRHWPRS